MKIAYIVPSLKQAGPVNVVMDLVSVMMSHGHQCIVYYFDNIQGNDFSCKTEKISMKTNIDWKSFDIIHSHGLRPNLYVLLHKPFMKNSKCITTMHNIMSQDLLMEYGLIKGLLGCILMWMSALRHNRIIVLTNTAKKYYKVLFPFKQIDVIPNTRIFSANLQIDEDDNQTIQSFKNKHSSVIGTVCCVLSRKGLEQIIYALRKLDSSVGFVLVGDGPDIENLKEIISSEGLCNRVLFLGGRDKGYRYMKFFDVFVIPSRSEGFPLALLEAASIGVACVSSNIPTFREIFDDCEVKHFELDNIDDCVNAIEYALNNKSDLSNRIHKRFLTDYSPDKFYNSHFDVYNK